MYNNSSGFRTIACVLDQLVKWKRIIEWKYTFAASFDKEFLINWKLAKLNLTFLHVFFICVLKHEKYMSPNEPLSIYIRKQHVIFLPKWKYPVYITTMSFRKEHTHCFWRFISDSTDWDKIWFLPEHLSIYLQPLLHFYHARTWLYHQHTLWYYIVDKPWVNH